VVNRSEADDVQLLLGWLLDPHQAEPRHEDAARQAAARLAAASRRLLAAGLDEGEVVDGWDDLLSTCPGCATCTSPQPMPRPELPVRLPASDPSDPLDRSRSASASGTSSASGSWRVGGLTLAIPRDVTQPARTPHVVDADIPLPVHRPE
jgi:hypothetical protein